MERSRIRAEFETNVSVHYQGLMMDGGDSRNISMSGMFLKTDLRPPLGDFCEVSIALQGSTGITLLIRSKVVRYASDGIGLAFFAMDEETYGHLQRLILYNADNPDAVVQQNETRPGFK